MSTGATSCSERLSIIIPLVLVLLLSVAINLRFIHHLYQIKKGKGPSKPIPMTIIAREDSILIKDTEIAWDNLLPEASGPGGPHVNAGIVGEAGTYFNHRQITTQA